MIYHGDCLEILRTLPDQSVNCCVTSPPYYGLRDYGVDGQIGLEPTPEAFVAKMVNVFREVRRVLRDDGTLWLNLGDSYNGYMANQTASSISAINQESRPKFESGHGKRTNSLGAKDLIGIPWRVAFALQADGWYLRQDIIWCLSGGTYVYAKTATSIGPMMIRDISRLRAGTVQLWNGEKWTNLLGISKSKRNGTEIQITLRSGERISCTPTHKFPVNGICVEAKDLKVGDVLMSAKLPNSNYDSLHIGYDAAYFVGLYLAEGSRYNGKISIAGHAKETSRWDRLNDIAQSYGGTATLHCYGNKQTIRMNGPTLNGLLDQFISGKTSKDKCLSPVCWKYSNEFLRGILCGYLDGDGHWEANNKRWRLGFTRNYNLERDLRTIAARLGYDIRIKLAKTKCNGKAFSCFHGELRMERSGHPNEKSSNEIISIQYSKCREVYDLGVEDEPHVFTLASGILTHNSKPNPMPESVRDRCTKAHEYIFLMSNSARYYFDAKAIAEPCVESNAARPRMGQGTNTQYSQKRKGMKIPGGWDNKLGSHATIHRAGRTEAEYSDVPKAETRNKRDVWTVSTKAFPEAHFATFPPKLIEPCILAGCPVGGTVLDPFFGAGTTGLVALQNSRRYVGIELNEKYIQIAQRRLAMVQPKLEGVA